MGYFLLAYIGMGFAYLILTFSEFRKMIPAAAAARPDYPKSLILFSTLFVWLFFWPKYLIQATLHNLGMRRK